MNAATIMESKFWNSQNPRDQSFTMILPTPTLLGMDHLQVNIDFFIEIIT